MVAENEDKKEVPMVSEVEGKELPPQKCATCKWWLVLGVNPQTRQGFGGCTNDAYDEAPFGVIMAGFGGCEGWEERPKVQVSNIAVPSRIARKMD